MNSFNVFNKLIATDFTSSSEIADKNLKKNRYGDVKPYDFNIVDKPCYVNASFLKSEICKIDFIATQGPIPTTFVDFWKMVHFNDVKVIVMLVEDASSKSDAAFHRGNCHTYWPSASECLYFEGLIIRNLSEIKTETFEELPNNCNNVIMREFEIECNNITKKVHHFHFLGWVDRSVVDSTALLDFLFFFYQFTKERHIFKNICVHCSAGCGRTGVFITMLSALDFMQDQAEDSDLIYKLVTDYRKQRVYFVQTIEQLEFCLKLYGSISKRVLSSSNKSLK
eukprot:NODE_330_length_10876_cov_0.359840.p4 type:complete len:281 gc:universal NODE_330_length_10876_cov_0.359840:3888-3046(-)